MTDVMSGEKYDRLRAEVERLTGLLDFVRGERDGAREEARAEIQKVARAVADSFDRNGKELAVYEFEATEARLRQLVGLAFYDLAELLWMEDEGERMNKMLERLGIAAATQETE